MKTTYLLLAFFLLLLISCKKEEPISYNQTDMWNCHHEGTWNAASTRIVLLGEWELEYVICGGRGGITGGEPQVDLTIEFKSDNTLTVTLNRTITQTASWKVVEGDADLYELDVEPFVSEIHGRILFCGSTVEFNDSYLDGCDNYFSRKN